MLDNGYTKLFTMESSEAALREEASRLEAEIFQQRKILANDSQKWTHSQVKAFVAQVTAVKAKIHYIRELLLIPTPK